ncbi:MAG: hypothetical protein SV862_20390, partial [Pseudomonadota bacterium]|nr:hypothetical protein [Pseudomonadota bacterium]
YQREALRHMPIVRQEERAFPGIVDEVARGTYPAPEHSIAITDAAFSAFVAKSGKGGWEDET